MTTTVGTHRATGALRSRGFRVVFAGLLVSQTGTWTTIVAQVMLVLHLGGDGVALGLLGVCQFLPLLVLGPWAGAVADRSDPLRSLKWLQAAAMLQSLLLAAVAATGAGLVWLYAVVAVGGVVFAFESPVRRTLTVELVDEEQVPSAVGMYTMAMTVARVVGPAVGGLVVATWGFTATFILDAVSYLAVLGSLWAVRPGEVREREPVVRAARQVREGLSYAWGHQELRPVLVMLAVVGTLGFNFSTVLPVLVTGVLGASSTWYTVMTSALGVGGLVGTVVATRCGPGGPRGVAMWSVAMGAAMVGLGVAGSPAAAVAAALVVGVCSTGFVTATSTVVQVVVDPAMRGRVLALQMLLFLGSTPVGAPLLGAVVQLGGPRWGVAVGAAACTAAGAWGLVARRTRDE